MIILPAISASAAARSESVVDSLPPPACWQDGPAADLWLHPVVDLLFHAGAFHASPAHKSCADCLLARSVCSQDEESPSKIVCNGFSRMRQQRVATSGRDPFLFAGNLGLVSVAAFNTSGSHCAIVLNQPCMFPGSIRTYSL